MDIRWHSGHACLSRGRISNSSMQGCLEQWRRRATSIKFMLGAGTKAVTLSGKGLRRCTRFDLQGSQMPRRRCERLSQRRRRALPGGHRRPGGENPPDGHVRRRVTGKRLAAALFRPLGHGHPGGDSLPDGRARRRIASKRHAAALYAPCGRDRNCRPRRRTHMYGSGLGLAFSGGLRVQSR